jgi:hypothetical protein
VTWRKNRTTLDKEKLLKFYSKEKWNKLDVVQKGRYSITDYCKSCKSVSYEKVYIEYIFTN